MWEQIYFDTANQLDQWIIDNGQDYQFTEIFINNGYGLEVRKKTVIAFD